MRILFIDTTHSSLKNKLELAGYTCDENYTSTKKEIQDLLHNYDGIIIRSRFAIDQEFLDYGSNLKFIGRVGAGLENIDLEYAHSKNIQCFSAPEGNRDAVGEHTLAMLLCLFNNLNRADREVRAGSWKREKNRGYELTGKTVGIIGYGNMGSAFAQRLAGFNCNVLAYDKHKTSYGDEYAKEASLDGIFEHADILSLHIPYTPENHYLVNDDFLSKFKKDIYLINTARGKVVETSALVKHLKSGKVKGACLDVLEYEKSSFENLYSQQLPEDFEHLINSDKVILSPHIAGWTHESNEKMATVLANKIIEAFK